MNKYVYSQITAAIRPSLQCTKKKTETHKNKIPTEFIQTDLLTD